jgi:membrane-bound serine protease (ClpP class)
MTLIIALILIGLVLITFELIIPGGILGGLAILAILGATAAAYFEYGLSGAILTFLSATVLGVLTVVAEYRILSKTSLGSKLFLKDTSSGKSNREESTDSILGKEGVALTRLSPTGMVVIDGASYEASSQSGLIDKGTSILVTDRDNFRIIVKKS